MREHGADVWFEREPKDLMPAGAACPACKGTAFRKETNILDVWFDSGVSHAAVLETRSTLRSPCDMYLEGSDQHRGWFHSSLLESVATRGRAPYTSVLTHGFVVDGEGRKMSKSVGNVIEPQPIIDEFGAEILRLWVAAEDYTVDIRISDEILERLVEAYRRIRNTSRFILGNLYDFDPKQDLVPYAEMEELDRWALYRLQAVIERTRKAYETFQFHIVYYTLYNFCTVDLSALYLDVLKDRLYTSGRVSKSRRSAQSAMFVILDAVTRMLAPVLTFTAEEVWQSLPAGEGKPVSVHLTQFPEVNPAWADEKLGDAWKTLIAVRGEISKAMETARKNKVIGHPLDAAVALTGPEKLVDLLAAHEEDLRALCIVSALRVRKGGELKDAFESAELPGLKVAVTKAGGEKCQRCWVFSEELGRDADHPKICPRCLKNLG